jgi:O-antigen ligase
MHPISGAEVNEVERRLCSYAGYVGLALLAVDGIASRERLDALVRRLVLGGVFLALVGMGQFVLNFDPYARLQIPGFHVSVELFTAGFGVRGEFHRAVGTTEQPIEFAAVLCAILPLAIHTALHASRPRQIHWWLATAVIAAAIPVSVSRTAVIGLMAALFTLAIGWTARQRLNAIAIAVLVVLLSRAAVPSLVGTYFSLFANSGQDNSVTGRTDRYGTIGRYFTDSPFIGWGLGRVRPGLPIVDNQYLATLVDGGLIALLALAVLFVVSMSVARGARRRAADEWSQSLGQSLAASIVVALATFMTYDALNFRVASVVLFIVIGAGGALWRLVREERPEVHGLLGQAHAVLANGRASGA